jgi:hypothetical protein
MRRTSLVIAFVFLAAAAVWMLNPRSQSIEFSTAAMPSLQELHTMAGVDKLPNQDIDDQSLVYTATPKQ